MLLKGMNDSDRTLAPWNRNTDLYHSVRRSRWGAVSDEERWNAGWWHTSTVTGHAFPPPPWYQEGRFSCLRGFT